MLKELSCYCPLWHAEYFKNFLIVKTSAHTHRQRHRHTHAHIHRAGQVVVTVVVLVGRHLIIQVCCFCYCKKNVCRLCVSRSLSRIFPLSLILSLFLSSSFPSPGLLLFLFLKNNLQQNDNANDGQLCSSPRETSTLCPVRLASMCHKVPGSNSNNNNKGKGAKRNQKKSETVDEA